MNFKFKAGDEVVVARRFSTNWCKVGDKHTIKLPKVSDGENVYVVDDHDNNVFIQECNLELVQLIVSRETTDPIKMRDTIIELEAYEEHFRLQREELTVELLAEGFVLVKAINTGLDKIDAALEASDPKSWVVGDTLTCLVSITHECYSVGKKYKVVKGSSSYDLCITDNYGEDSWCGFDYPEFAQGESYKFAKV